MKILQISCSYLPDNIGGTEVYVHNLSKELVARSHQVFISYVGGFYEENGLEVRSKEYIFDGVSIFAIEKNFFNLRTRQLYFDSEELIYPLFKDYLKRIKPDIVHFHHFSPTDVITQMKAAKEMSLPIILTYHTPMMTCGHSDMLYLGKSPCDGRIDYKRCLVCAQTKYGLPLLLAYGWANLPKSMAQYLSNYTSVMDTKGRFATWLQFPWLMYKRIEKWQVGFKMADHFVAVCQWVYELLLKNDIPKEKITLCRQGVGGAPAITRVKKDNVLRLGYLGRIHPVKGIDVLLKAFKLLPPHYQIELCIYGLSQNTSDDNYYNKLCQQSHKDKRIKWLGILSEKEKFQVLSQIDALMISSRWLETGPLVLLESWAVGTPVIGANLGGISELITDGIGGLLFKSEDARDLVKVITRVYKDPELLERLKANIPKVRTMKEVADDMDELYRRLLIWQKIKHY